MKRLFIYYSLSGSGDAVAEKMKLLGADVRKVAPKKEISGPFLIKMLRGGFNAARKAAPELKDFDPSVEGYDEVIIGSPIWNSRIAPPVNTVLKKLSGSEVKKSFILWSGGGTAPKAVERIGAEYPGADIIILNNPSAYPAELEKISLEKNYA